VIVTLLSSRFQFLIPGWCSEVSHTLCISHKFKDFLAHFYPLVNISPRNSTVPISST
jgi:hypothetical protein